MRCLNTLSSVFPAHLDICREILKGSQEFFTQRQALSNCLLFKPSDPEDAAVSVSWKFKMTKTNLWIDTPGVTREPKQGRREHGAFAEFPDLQAGQ